MNSVLTQIRVLHQTDTKALPEPPTIQFTNAYACMCHEASKSTKLNLLYLQIIAFRVYFLSWNNHSGLYSASTDSSPLLTDVFLSLWLYTHRNIHLTHWPFEDVEVIQKVQLLNSLWRIQVAWALALRMLPGEGNMTSLLTGRHWFR